MSLEHIHLFNLVIGLGVIALQVVAFIALVLLLVNRKNIFLDLIKKNFLWIGLTLSLAAVLASLIYSYIIGWVPCRLCWYDRIYVIPQVLVFAIAIWRKDKNAFWYSLALTICGLINASYHLFIYYLGEGTAPCDASGISCVQRLVSEFGGYISIPTEAFTGFAALLVLLLVVYFYKYE